MKLVLKDFINSYRGKLVFSLLLGLGLASLFRKACNSRNCLVFKAPPLEKIKGKIFGYNGKCYKFTEESVSCNDSSNNEPYKLD
uniref:Uncharacterized protein n=1 Tax=viral metagenome TaxID=1070528 RepID=A0A6C0AY67_9ZZZZ|tara:strand:+ start:268 stop:519 length:252 start_codon:yes stop_codon:yes gene_type:complete